MNKNKVQYKQSFLQQDFNTNFNLEINQKNVKYYLEIFSTQMQGQQNQSSSQWIVISNKSKGKAGKIKQTCVTHQQVYAISSMPLANQFQSHYASQFFSSQTVVQNTHLIKSFLKQLSHIYQLKQYGEYQSGQPKLKIYLNCLGIGDFISKLKPALQYHFFIHILKVLQDSVCGVNIYDPILTIEHYDKIKFDIASKKQQQQKKKFFQLARNQKFVVEQNGVNIFYMPHCQRFLYQRLCEQAFKVKKRAIVLVIGNSISQYIERCKLLNQDVPQGFTNTKLLKQTRLKDYKEAFNDTFIYLVA